jgi:glutamine amidotransferase
MCRHLAYVGAPIALHELLFGAPHSLCEQALHPRHQTSGSDNPHGWGVAWYEPGATAPARHRTVTPIWDDAAFADRARDTRGTAVLAAARLASPGAALVESGNAPFIAGLWAFSLNGVVHDFRGEAGDALRAHIGAARTAALEGDSDTEVVFAIVRARLDAGDSPGEALTTAVDEITAITTGRLNLLLTDGVRVAATRFGNSLFVREGTVASEPLDGQSDWRAVPDSSLVEIEGDAVSVSSM